MFQISVFGRQNKSFRLPDKLSMPVIMIGPGTGVAPFRGFLQKLRHRNGNRSAEEKIGDTWLFFGCRNKNLDFIYE